MILIELTAAIDAAGTLKTFYVSTDSFVSKPTDTPANTFFEPTLIDPGSFGVQAFTDGRTGGGVQLQTGDIVLSNAEGQYDAWKGYGFDGRAITIRYGDPSSGYPGSLTTLFSGTVEGVEITWEQAVIRLRDKQFILQVPMLPNHYAGTNSLPNGIEGTANDIKGQVKPRLYGRVYNIAPPCVNTSLLIYQVSDRAVDDISAVYDRGASVTKGSDYATNALLQAATVTSGTYATCMAEGLFRLGSAPAGLITADATEYVYGSYNTAGQILKRMALDAGVPSGSISGSDVAAMDVSNSAALGIWVNDASTFVDAMDQIANSIGAYYGFDGSGTLRMAVLTPPSGTAVLTLEDWQVLEGIERKIPSNTAIPLWAAQVNHSKVYSVQDSDLAGSVTQAQRGFIGKEYRSVRSEDASIKTQFLLAQQLIVDSLMVDTTGASASTEADRLLALFKVPRDIFDVPVPLDVMVGTSLPMLSVVSLVVSRFGMSSGKLFRLIGYQLELSQHQLVLTLWG